MNRLFSETIFGIPWVLLAAAALIVAAVYVVIDTGAGADGLGWLVLRWFHPLCWFFLSAAALTRAKVTPIPVDWAGMLGAIGGVLYLVSRSSGLRAAEWRFRERLHRMPRAPCLSRAAKDSPPASEANCWEV